MLDHDFDCAICAPFVFSWHKRGKPLNDVVWYLTCPVADGIDYELDPACGTRIVCSSALTLEDALKEAKATTDDIKMALKGWNESKLKYM